MNNYRTICLFLLVAASFSAAAQQSRQNTYDSNLLGKNPQAGHFMHLRGFNMYYEIYGQGQPLLIIHGNGGSIGNFLYQVPYFSKKYKVILADSRSQGKSTDQSDSLSYEMMTDDLNALLDSLHTDSCLVIGWSDGGINGLLLALRHPDKVKKLAVTGANLWPDSTAVDPYIYHWALDYNKMLAGMPTSPAVKNQRKLAHLLSFEPHIASSSLAAIKCATLVIGGDHDVLLPRHTLLIAESIPKSYLWILPNSGHSTPIFYHEQFNAVVDDFFEKPYRKIEGLGRMN